MRLWFSIFEAIRSGSYGTGRLLREWLPGWSGSVAVHGAAVCCLVAGSQFGPQIWPVTQGRSSVESAPAMDSRAGDLVAKFDEGLPPLRLETLAMPEVSDSEPRSPNLHTLTHSSQRSAESLSREQLEQDLPMRLRESRPTPQSLPNVNVSTQSVAAFPATILDDELLRPTSAMPVEDVATTEPTEVAGPMTVAGNAAQDSVAAPASAASRGAENQQLPRPVATNEAPVYPEEARAAGLQGKVTLQLHIGVDGRVESLKVLKSSGANSLDEAALATVKRWRFEPARRNGRPLAMDVKTSVNFQIEAE